MVGDMAVENKSKKITILSVASSSTAIEVKR
jgi:hypothetical protein